MNSSMFDLTYADYNPTVSVPAPAPQEVEEEDEKAKRRQRLKELGRMLSKSAMPGFMPTVSLSELYEMIYTDRPSLIEDFLSAGTYILAGAPKVGKSFLVAQIAYHVSRGLDLWNRKTHQATVLYLALEDDYRRIQSRMGKMFGYDENPELFFSTIAKTLDSGLEEQLSEFIAGHPGTKLIIIDTLQKIRDDTSETYSYAKDYEIIGRLKQFADSKNICLLIVHHTRKQQAGDKFDMISGTSGILGCADGAFILSKEHRTDNHATLNTVGRDSQDQKFYLVRNEETLVWDFKRCETQLWKEKPDELILKIAKLINADNPRWSGTATELLQVLEENITPNIISRKLNCKASMLLNEFNIEYSTERTSDKRIINLEFRA